LAGSQPDEALITKGGSGDTRRAMSRENVELTLRVFEAFNRRDFDGLLAMLDDSITWRSLFSVEAQLLQGKEPLRAHWASQVEAVDVYLELQELISVGDSRVVAVAKWSGHGQASGVSVDASAAQVFTIQRAKVVCVETYASKSEALEAAGRASGKQGNPS
jgi:ketosteroid isomerase-like protein